MNLMDLMDLHMHMPPYAREADLLVHMSAKLTHASLALDFQPALAYDCLPQTAHRSVTSCITQALHKQA